MLKIWWKEAVSLELEDFLALNVPNLRIDAKPSLVIRSKQSREDASRKIVLDTSLLSTKKARHVEDVV